MFHGSENGTCFVVEGRILFRFFVELDVEVNQCIALACLDGCAVAPSLVRNDHFAKLGTPIAEVIDADTVIAAECMELL